MSATRTRARAAIVLVACAAALTAHVAFGEVRGQGPNRTGAVALDAGAEAGANVEIAILDLGFGRNLAARRRQGEIPDESRVETRSFDTERGLAGANAYGNPTAHGELVAQTVFDYAPGATYIFVNYHSVEQFVQAADWLARRRPDVVVHANNFLEGPFDGTSAAARAVDRVAAAGVLWVNSAGNYGTQHWSGSWLDEDADGALDWPAEGSFSRPRGSTTTFVLSWDNPDGVEPTDLDLVLEQRTDRGWESVREARDRQGEGAPATERVLAYTAPADGVYRLRVLHWGGPLPVEKLTLFSREVPLAAVGGTSSGSVPTPGDAAGSLTVGAVDYRSDAIKAYSSQGPTADGRTKPDLVAPTGTLVRGPNGPRGVGGTSIAAPNAAGAAALLISSLRQAGLRPTAAEIRDRLVADARDLGPPGFDPVFGAGVVRLSDEPPAIVLRSPTGLPVGGRVRIRADLSSAIPLRRVSATVDGRLVASASGDLARFDRPLDSRPLQDGPHRLEVSAVDWAGNRGGRTLDVVIDNTPPALGIVAVRRGRRATPRGRTVAIALRAADAGRLTGEVRLVSARGSRRYRLGLAGPGRASVGLGRLPAGRYRVEVSLRDPAGNAATAARRFAVRAPRPRTEP